MKEFKMNSKCEKPVYSRERMSLKRTPSKSHPPFLRITSILMLVLFTLAPFLNIQPVLAQAVSISASSASQGTLVTISGKVSAMVIPIK